MAIEPRIELDPPPGWQFKEQVTVISPADETGAVHANVIASSEAASEVTDPQSYAMEMGRQLQRECPGYTELSLEPMDVFGGSGGWLRRFEWQPESRRVTQLQAYYAQGERVFTATATAESDDFPLVQNDLVAVLRSLSLHSP